MARCGCTATASTLLGSAMVPLALLWFMPFQVAADSGQSSEERAKAATGPTGSTSSSELVGAIENTTDLDKALDSLTSDQNTTIASTGSTSSSELFEATGNTTDSDKVLDLLTMDQNITGVSTRVDFTRDPTVGCCQGSGYGGGLGWESAYDCKRRCAEESTCEAISWAPSTWCTRYTSCNTVKLSCGANNLAWETWKKDLGFRPLPTRGCCQAPGYGGSLGYESAYQCKRRCAEESTCEAISWAPSTWCTRYTSCNTVKLSCGNNHLAWETWEKDLGFRVRPRRGCCQVSGYGGGLGWESAYDCKKKCAEEDKCEAISWAPSTWCTRYTSCDRVELNCGANNLAWETWEKDLGFRPLPTRGCCQASGYGGGLGYESAYQCKRRCAEDDNCEAISWAPSTWCTRYTSCNTVKLSCGANNLAWETWEKNFGFRRDSTRGCCQGSGYAGGLGYKSAAACKKRCATEDHCTAISWAPSTWCTRYTSCNQVKLSCGNNALAWETWEKQFV